MKSSVYCTLIIFGTAYGLTPEIIKEIIVFGICVLVGTGGALAFDSRNNQIKFRRIVASLFMGIFIGFLARELAQTFEILSRYKVFLMAGGAGASEYILNWFSKRHMGLLDGLWSILNVIVKRKVKEDESKEKDNNGSD